MSDYQSDVKILSRKPDEATHVCKYGYFWKWIKGNEYQRWSHSMEKFIDGYSPRNKIRLIEDIQNNIRLANNLMSINDSINGAYSTRAFTNL